MNQSNQCCLRQSKKILTGVSRNRAYTNAPTINTTGNTNTAVNLDNDFMNVHLQNYQFAPICSSLSLQNNNVVKCHMHSVSVTKHVNVVNFINTLLMFWACCLVRIPKDANFEMVLQLGHWVLGYCDFVLEVVVVIV